MNPMLTIALAYFEKHPEAVESLVDAGVKALVAYLQTKHAAKP